MKNSLGDLNNHLFAQMERLSDEELTGDKLTAEIERTKSLTSVSREIVSNATLMLKAKELSLEYAQSLDLPQLTSDRAANED